MTDQELDLLRAWECLRQAETLAYKAATLLAENFASELLAIKLAVAARKSCEEAFHSVDNLIPRTSP